MHTYAHTCIHTDSHAYTHSHTHTHAHKYTCMCTHFPHALPTSSPLAAAEGSSPPAPPAPALSDAHLVEKQLLPYNLHFLFPIVSGLNRANGATK